MLTKAIADTAGGLADKANADKASSLADKALNKIAAAQQEMHRAAPTLDALSWMKSNAGSPVSPKAGAFSQPSSAQHNSRFKTWADADRRRQLLRDSSVQLQQLSSASESAAHRNGQGGTAAQGCGVQPLHSPSDAPAQAKWSPSKVRERCHQETQSSLAQPSDHGRTDAPEGPQHAANPGSQAAALGSMAGSKHQSAEAPRCEATAA